MVRVLLVVIALAAAGAPLTASAQGFAPTPPAYATSPGSTALPPVQQQVLENYRSQLQQTRREMLQQNPSGLGREQIEVGRQLNTYNAAPPASYAAPAPPSVNRVPSASPYAAPIIDRPPHVTHHATHYRAPQHPISEGAATR